MKDIPAYLLFFFFVAGFSNSACRPDYNDTLDTVASPIVSVVKELKVSDSYYLNKIIQKTAAFYEGNDFKKHWLEKRGASKRFKAFVEEVKNSYQYGMNTDDYDIDQFQHTVDELYDDWNRSDEEMSALDIRITASFFLFTTHLIEGRLRYPGAKDFIWKKGMPQEDDVAILLTNDSKKELKDDLERLHPSDPQYGRLRKALNEYRLLAKNTSGMRIPNNLKLKPGDRSRHIPSIRKRMELTDMPPVKVVADSTLYDSLLVSAIKKFQRRHGLNEDGLINNELAFYFNMSFGDLNQIIALNLERLRWKPAIQYKDENIVINIPEYILRVFHNDNEKFSMRVVLGSEFNATPIFSDTLKYIVFSPTWNVPTSIIEEEFLPNLQANPEYYNSGSFTFYKDGVEIDPAREDWNDEDLNIRLYQVVQNPGDANSLGRVKFMMPNNFSIYLHDTPADKLFKKEERAFSHGCIRLEKPADFAAYLLRKQKGWDDRRIADAMKLEEPKTVTLAKSVPVHIVYRTAWVDDEGSVHFRKDIYGHDERQLWRLRKQQQQEIAKISGHK